MLKPAIFLDRDGVLNVNRPNYVRTPQELVMYPKALAAMAGIATLPFPIVIVTNQSGIGRGMIAPDVSDAINQKLVAEVEAAGGRIDAVYVCPHHPDDRCGCRKPMPGLLQQAAAAHNLDLRQSIMVGDALTDVEAGRAAGVAHAALILTGRGRDQSAKTTAKHLAPLPIFDDLTHALAVLIPKMPVG